jgi:hypothetical protein
MNRTIGGTVMRKLLLFCGVVTLLMAPTAAAAPIACPVASLDAYMGLSSEGCFVGPAVLTDFVLGPGTTIDPTAVSVTPASLAAEFSLAFGLNQSAAAGELPSILIRYSVTGAGFFMNALSMTGASATGDGVVTAIEDKCLDDVFLGVHPSAGCPTSTVSHTALAIEGLDIVPPPVAFVTTSFFDVFVEVVIDGGTAGSAALQGSVVNTFHFQSASVPEPATVLLLGPAAALLLHTRHLRRRAARMRAVN